MQQKTSMPRYIPPEPVRGAVRRNRSFTLSVVGLVGNRSAKTPIYQIPPR
jgi:hypothetical protein